MIKGHNKELNDQLITLNGVRIASMFNLKELPGLNLQLLA